MFPLAGEGIEELDQRRGGRPMVGTLDGRFSPPFEDKKIKRTLLRKGRAKNNYYKLSGRENFVLFKRNNKNIENKAGKKRLEVFLLQVNS